MTEEKQTTQTVPLNSLFHLERVPSSFTRLLLMMYGLVGAMVFVCRLFIGVHAFIVACLVRKSTTLRCTVLRIMSALLGIVVRQKGQRQQSVKMLAANHVTALDHLAVDLLEPCILPSVWDIPSLLQWCFGYADLGAGNGRAELIKRAKEHIEKYPLPLLAFPEGAICSGKVALLKFSNWPAEVSASIQPISVSVWRPLEVNPAILGSTWWSDVLWFMFLPCTVVNVHFLPVVTRRENEALDDFTKRVSQSIADDLHIQSSSWTSANVAEAVKLRLRAARPPVKRKPLDPRIMDELAMKIKQSHPKIPLLAIRLDLDLTKDYMETIDRIKTGKLTDQTGNEGKASSSSADWKTTYDTRKWEMIETNRSRYLSRMTSDLAAGDN